MSQETHKKCRSKPSKKSLKFWHFWANFRVFQNKDVKTSFVFSYTACSDIFLWVSLLTFKKTHTWHISFGIAHSQLVEIVEICQIVTGGFGLTPECETFEFSSSLGDTTRRQSLTSHHKTQKSNKSAPALIIISNICVCAVNTRGGSKLQSSKYFRVKHDMFKTR